MALVEVSTIRGKGNKGMYTERLPRIYAAGIRSKQPNLQVVDCLNYINLPITDDNTKHTHINMLQHVRRGNSKDMRNAGPFTESMQLINPPMMTKFQTVVEDLKNTVYKSYWSCQVGKKADLSSCIPPELDINNTTFGKPTKTCHNLYDVIMPKRSLSPEKTSKCPGYQLKRHYCSTSFNLNMIHGHKTNSDKSGKFVKCCLTDDNFTKGTSLKKPILTAQHNYNQRHNPELESCLMPNNNINCVPEGHAFGKLEPKDGNNASSCLSYCELNRERDFYYKCLAHLNTLRKCLSKKFDGPFFHNFYLQMRYLDKSSCGWLPKKLVYHLCVSKFIRFTPSLIEPLLIMWGAINDTDIEYKTFVNVINFREPVPDLPKVHDIPPNCAEFNTTYKEMTKPQEPNISVRAGISSGRYFDRVYPVTPDGFCKADRSYLPQESDARSCLSPSLFTLLGVSHRDMYAQRNPETVKSVFQAAGEEMSDHMFNEIWDCATTYHPKGLVSYETFRRALNEYKSKFGDTKIHTST